MSKIKANTIENVAGTESHDVANMGIENGSDANGYYTKFPDGTMIQWGIGSTTDTSVTITFAIPFTVGTESVTLTGFSSQHRYVMLGGSTTNVSFSARGYNGETVANVGFNWQAIGRWK